MDILDKNLKLCRLISEKIQQYDGIETSIVHDKDDDEICCNIYYSYPNTNNIDTVTCSFSEQDMTLIWAMPATPEQYKYYGSKTITDSEYFENIHDINIEIVLEKIISLFNCKM